MSAERAALDAERSAAAHEIAALRSERRELEFVKAELEKAMPSNAAARIQSRVRAVRARVECSQLRAARVLDDNVERGRAAAERQVRDEACSARASTRAHNGLMRPPPSYSV